MRVAWLVARRELGSTLSALPTYAAGAVFLCLAALFFNAALHETREASLRSFVEPLDFLVLTFVPLLAARSLAEERRTGTAEVLLTLPAAPWSIVAGKFAAVVVVGLLAASTTLAFPVVLEVLGSPDRGPMVSQYLGVALLVCAMAGVGVAASALSSSSAFASSAALVAALVLWFAGTLDDGAAAGWGLAGLSIEERLGSLNRGVVDVADISYFASIVAVSLAVATSLVAADRLRR